MPASLARLTKSILYGDFADRCDKEVDGRRSGGGKGNHGKAALHQTIRLLEIGVKRGIERKRLGQTVS